MAYDLRWPLWPWLAGLHPQMNWHGHEEICPICNSDILKPSAISISDIWQSFWFTSTMNFGCDLHVASRRHVLFYRIAHGLPRIDVGFFSANASNPKKRWGKNGQCVLENLYSAWNISSDWLKFHGISYGIQWDLMGYTYLVGGWNHGILNDFPETVGNGSHHPNWRFVIFFSWVGSKPPTSLAIMAHW